MAHAGESLLGKLRDGKLALNPLITNALLRMVDAIRTMLSDIENTGREDGEDDRALLDQLNRLASSQPVDRDA